MVSTNLTTGESTRSLTKGTTLNLGGVLQSMGSARS